MTFPAYPLVASPKLVPSLPGGTIPLPVWAYGTDPEPLKVDPTNAKREIGWTTVQDQTYGEEPPLQYFNNEQFNNGQWATYFLQATDYLKAGNFDSGVHVTGLSTFNSVVHSLSDITCLSGSSLTFARTDNLYGISFSASGDASAQNYILTKTLPSLNGLPLTCSISSGNGILNWDYLNAAYVKGSTSPTPPASGFIGETKQSKILNATLPSNSGFVYNNPIYIDLDIGWWLISANFHFTTLSGNPGGTFVTGISKDGSTTYSDIDGANNSCQGYISNITTTISQSIPNYDIGFISSNNTRIYLKSLQLSAGVYNYQFSGRINAVRIA